MEKLGAAEPQAQAATSDEERRTAPRFAAKDLPGLGMKLSTGGDVRLLDFSQSGARFECDRRLLPGSTVALAFMTTDTPVVVRGRVVRARLTRLASGGLGYEVAVAFERLLEINPEALSAAKAGAQPAVSASVKTAPPAPPAVTAEPAATPSVSVFAAAAAAMEASAHARAAASAVETAPAETPMAAEMAAEAETPAHTEPAAAESLEDVPELLLLTATVQRSRNDLWQVFNGNDW